MVGFCTQIWQKARKWEKKLLGCHNAREREREREGLKNQ